MSSTDNDPLSGRPILAESRLNAIAEAIRSAGAISVGEVEERFGVSPMTARRDLAKLARTGVVRRTRGGAVLPGISGDEDSFATRLATASEAKRKLAAIAASRLRPRETVFLDSSTTSFFVAQRIVEEGLALTVLTNGLPLMQLLSTQGGPKLEVIGVGGTLRRLTQSFVGQFAVQTVRGHFADRMFLSVKAVMPDGTLTDADQLEAEVKRAMIGQSAEPVLLVDGSKLRARGLSVITSVFDLAGVVAHGASAPELAALRTGGAHVEAIEVG